MRITHLLGALALAVFTFSFAAPSAEAAADFVTVKHAKAKWAGRPACKSKFPAGKGQGAAFRHLLTESCYSCPSGYKRTVFPINAKNACQRVIKAKALWSKASFRGKLLRKKPSGAFLDPRNGGEYWTCPRGTHRTVLHAVNSSKACERRARTSYAKASKYRKNSRIGQGCPSGKFWDVKGGNGLLGACYSCPRGYKRSASSVSSSKACYKRIRAALYKAKKVGNLKNPKPAGAFLDPRNKGEYWSCPKGYERTVAYPVNHKSRACKKNIPGKSYAAKSKKRGTWGCKPGAFKNGLENACYTCPATYKRSAVPGTNLHKNSKACVYVKVDPGALLNADFLRWATEDIKKFEKYTKPIISQAAKVFKTRKSRDLAAKFPKAKSDRERANLAKLFVADMRKWMHANGPVRRASLDIRHARFDGMGLQPILAGPRMNVASATGLTGGLIHRRRIVPEARGIQLAQSSRDRAHLLFPTISLTFVPGDISLGFGFTGALMWAWDISQGSRYKGIARRGTSKAEIYGSMAWSVGLSAGLDMGLELGFWTDPNDKLDGENHGFIVAASVKAGLGMSHWWNYGDKKWRNGDKVHGIRPKYLGMTVFPQVGVSAEVEYVRGDTIGTGRGRK